MRPYVHLTACRSVPVMDSELRSVYTYRLRLRARLRARQVFTLCQWKRAVILQNGYRTHSARQTARFHWHNVKT